MEIPLHPPRSWFEHPGSIPTDRRITIEPNGRVYGYVKLHGACHTGAPGCVTAPSKSKSNYGLAHQGRTLTAEGEEIATAIIAGGSKRHADLGITDPVAAALHYQEGVENQLMRVRYGDDENGVWFSGALWPDADELTIEKIRATPNSGDWRYVRFEREHDLAGACLVNIPGFAMANAGESAFKSGMMQAIAASGAGVTGDGNIVVDPDGYARDEPHTKDDETMTCTCGGHDKSDDKQPEGEAAKALLASINGEEKKTVGFEEAVAMTLTALQETVEAQGKVIQQMQDDKLAASVME